MPATRAAKRRKTSHGTEDSNEAILVAPHEARLEALNDMSSLDFQSKYVPKDKLFFQPTNHQHHLSEEERSSFGIEYLNAGELDGSALDKCFRLVQETSMHDYQNSSRGWHPRRKRAEMKESNMRYCIIKPQLLSEEQSHARGGQSSVKLSALAADESYSSGQTSRAASSQSSEQPELAAANEDEQGLDSFGFMSFQLDDDWVSGLDNRIPILYLYEIHLGKRLRGLGLGKYLMDLAKHIAQATEMSKVELSVFTSNNSAVRFYRSLGYTVDETSPATVVKNKQTVEADWHCFSIDLRQQ